MRKKDIDEQDVIRTIGQINDAAHMLEMALRRAQDYFESDDCPLPLERWDDPAELKTLMEGGSVRLTILGTAHPPVKVETEVRK